MIDKVYEKAFLEGEIIFREGETGEEIYLIDKGEVKIFKEIEGSEKILAVLKEGEVFGEMSVLDGKPRSASAKAIKDTILRIMNREALIEYIRQNPFMEYLVNTLIERLRIADEKIKFLSIKPEEVRLLSFLKWASSTSHFPCDTMKISLFTGLSEKRIKELLAKYKSSFFVKEKDGVIEEIDEKKLEDYKNFLLKEKNIL